MFSDFMTIIASWIFLSFFAFVSFVWINKLVGTALPDRGWGFARVIGWLMVGVPIWFLAHLGIPINTQWGVWLTVALLLALAIWQLKKDGLDNLIKEIRSAKKLILTEETLFLFGLVFLSLIRGFNPDINSLEKFMDAGLMVSYQNSPTLPIEDMWLAGYSFNYYTFGHFLGSIMMFVTNLKIGVGYNIALSFILGLMLTQAFSLTIAFVNLGKKVSQRVLIIAGLLGAFLVNFGSNTHLIWYFLSHSFSFKGYWYPDATRFIYHTIHEFPTYSYIVSDLHAHVWSMSLVLLTIMIVYLWFITLIQPAKRLVPRVSNFLVWAGLMGFMLGLLASTSTWDLLVYGLFIFVLGTLVLFASRGKLFLDLAKSAVVASATTIFAALPWYLNFESISAGPRWVKKRSSLEKWLILWTEHVFVTVLALVASVKTYLERKNLKKVSPYLFIIALIVVAWLLLVLPEIFYMKDIYPDHPRANTMFKLTFQAQIMMNLVIAWFLGWTLSTDLIKKQVKYLTLAIIITFTVITGIYPYFGYRDFYNHLKTYHGLDGLSFLKTNHPTDYLAIEWLANKVPDRPVVLEAVGDSYTTFARVSAFSGKPTPLGWRVHEWLWRGSYDLPGKRDPQIENIYQNPLSAESLESLKNFKVKYIFVGDKEREAYPEIDEVGLKQLGEVVYQVGNTYIIKLQ